MWSDTYNRLSFTIWKGPKRDGEYLRSLTDKPKALYFGKKEFLTFFGNKKPTILVEDVISAIKVGRHAKAAPLFGMHLKPSLRKQLISESAVVFWLDHNMYIEAIKQASELRAMGIPSYVIKTIKDPKDLSDSEIQKEIRDCLSIITSQSPALL